MAKAPKDNPASLGGEARKQLKSLRERICELLDQKETLNEDLKEIFDEAREAGFDTKIMRKAIKRIRAGEEASKAEEEMIEAYEEAMKQGDLFTPRAAA